MKTVTLSEEDFAFITDSALNGLWVECEKNMRDIFLGDKEQNNLIECRDRCKRLMKEINPNIFN